MTQPHPLKRTLGLLSWATYLACSWTWCIGMFLPVLLVRDYALAGFFVFAIPNIVGAAALGWILSPDQSRHLARTHREATLAFSLVTIAFHGYFIMWLTRMTADAGLVPPRFAEWGLQAVGGIGLILLLIFGAACWANRNPEAQEHMGAQTGLARARLGSALLWLFSAAACVILLARPAFAPATEKFLPAAAPAGATWLAPICLFGFALCPYLDATFLRARTSTRPVEGRWAFSLGFGLFFALMICFTLLYAGLGIATLSAENPPAMAPWVATLLLTHILLQAGFTCIVHVQEACKDYTKPRWRLEPGLFAIVCLLAGAALGTATSRETELWAGLTFGEIGYRVFMAAYGLVFPAYVWSFVIPRQGLSSLPSRGEFIRFIIVIGLASPCFWMGFIERNEIWLIPGLLIALASRFICRSARISNHLHRAARATSR